MLRTMDDPVSEILACHEATKHRLNRYARGPGGLDWATQPDPFRRYAGAPVIPLDRPEPGDEPTYDSVFTEGLTVHPPDRAAVSRLFYDSLALSAWKQAGGARWALRVNPSSGNLHPTEGYLICGPVDGLCDAPSVFHYAPKEHALEKRAEFSDAAWKALAADLPDGALLIGISSIHWREAWKYGERAFRYCRHDAGHAIAAVTLAATALGWKAALIDGASSGLSASLMGLRGPREAEPEEAECLLAVHPRAPSRAAMTVPEAAADTFAELAWTGTPNPLSPAHVDWPLIDRATSATRKPATRAAPEPFKGADIPPDVEPEAASFRRIVHRRRSCLALDGRTGLTAEGFNRILSKVMPGPDRPPFDALPWRPMIHLGLFIHRVQDVDPGLYALVRDPDQTGALRGAMKQEFAWERPPACPAGLGLYRLLTGDARELSRQIACHQEIASDGCFSLGMIAEFEEPLRSRGAWFYRRLFWEAGLIGQVLYLEAGALGLGGTGIGCYFDDPMHDVLGLEGGRFQDLYHFTIGGAVEDRRLTTLPAYPDSAAEETADPLFP